MGEIGIVPDNGSQVEEDGYQADKLRASLRSSLVTLSPSPETRSPILVIGSAPEE
jgi:hypothetical protein